jgi:hypothetical protein
MLKVREWKIGGVERVQVRRDGRFCRGARSTIQGFEFSNGNLNEKGVCPRLRLRRGVAVRANELVGFGL